MSRKHHYNPITKVDVIIPVYGSFEYVERCLNALPNAFDDVPYKIILVDDKSNLPEKEIIAFYDKIKDNYKCTILRHIKNEGFPATCNDGAQKGDSKYILFLNTDVVLFANSAKIMYNKLANYADIAIVGPKLLFPNNQDDYEHGSRIQHAGVVFDVTGRPYHLFSGWNTNHPYVNRELELNAVTGACMMVNRGFFDKVRGFDVAYGKGTYEDIQLCLLARLGGLKVVYKPEAVGTHYTGYSVKKAQEGYPLTQNSLLFRSRFDKVIPYDEFLYNGPIKGIPNDSYFADNHPPISDG